MPKFFIKQEQIKENERVEIIGEDAFHIAKVLRMQTGEEITICNENTSQNYLCSIFRIEKEKIICQIKSKIESKAEPKVYIHILQGLPKADKMEWIIEKGTEVGVSEFTPIKMKYCITKLEEKEEKKKIERWQKIAQVAAKQSGRDKIPIVNLVKNLKNIYEITRKCDIVLVAYEKEQQNTLKKELEKIKQEKKKENLVIGIIIGPEGGIAQEEIELLETLGGKIITLGTRILRTETAPIVIASNLLYELEG